MYLESQHQRGRAQWILGTHEPAKLSLLNKSGANWQTQSQKQKVSSGFYTPHTKGVEGSN